MPGSMEWSYRRHSFMRCAHLSAPVRRCHCCVEKLPLRGISETRPSLEPLFGTSITHDIYIYIYDQMHPPAMISSLIQFLFHNKFLFRPNQIRPAPAAMNAPLTIEGFHPKLITAIEQLDDIAPRFELESHEIEILNHPAQFYETLKKKILSAKSRVFLSSLYVGKAQHELIEVISQALRENSDLEVYLLTDCLRSTRESPGKSSASLLARLEKEFGSRVDIRLYHTPQLNGLKKRWIPRRFNEGWGLQHMKIYGVDDEVMLSGANLSEDYFTDRQDRYYIFKHGFLAEYYFRIQSAVSSVSYKLLSSETEESFSLHWPSCNKAHEPHTDPARFVEVTTSLLAPLLQSADGRGGVDRSSTATTIVYPVSQFTPLLKPDTSTEKRAILSLLSFIDHTSINWTFTAGYFNMLPEIQQALLETNASGSIITAAPQANSFYQSPGVSKYLPDAYLYLAKSFLSRVRDAGKSSLIKVYEWRKGVVNTPDGWSYHAKGIWITCPEETSPSATVIGSSNYTKRAYSLDLETNVVLITKDEDLKSQMAGEIENLMTFTKEIKLEDFEHNERRISKGVVLATKLVGGKM